MVKRKKKIGSKEDTTMKKNILSMAALLMASAAVFTACSSDDNISSEQPANPTGKYTMTVQASKDGDAATRALTLSGSTLNATWATTENVYVKKGSDWATGSLKPQADGATATLKGSLSGIEINATDALTLQFPKSGTPVYTGQVGTLADIAANYDYATASVTVTSVDGSGNITVNEPATFTNQQSIVKFTLKNGETLLNAGTVRVQATYGGSSPIFDIVFTIPDNTYTTNGDGIIYLAIPNTSSYLSNLASIYSMSLDVIKSSCKLNITATVGSDTYTYTKNGWPFEDGQYYDITVKMTKPAPPTLAETLTTAGMTVKVNFNYYDEENYCQFLSNGDGTYTFDSGEGFVGGDDDCAKALVVEGGKLVFKQSFFETIDFQWGESGFSVTFDTSNNTYSEWRGENAAKYSPSFISVEVNGTTIDVTIK